MTNENKMNDNQLKYHEDLQFKLNTSLEFQKAIIGVLDNIEYTLDFERELFRLSKIKKFYQVDDMEIDLYVNNESNTSITLSVVGSESTFLEETRTANELLTVTPKGFIPFHYNEGSDVIYDLPIYDLLVEIVRELSRWNTVMGYRNLLDDRHTSEFYENYLKGVMLLIRAFRLQLSDVSFKLIDGKLSLKSN